MQSCSCDRCQVRDLNSNYGGMAEETIVVNYPTQLCIGMSEMFNPD